MKIQECIAQTVYFAWVNGKKEEINGLFASLLMAAHEIV
jgi:hypothetical protein